MAAGEVEKKENRCDLDKLFKALAGILERRENNEVKITFTITPRKEEVA